ncbi:TetR/AcrR family transcriptional regulator [uncultured Roseovarius sp.]|uniref:TetR/AcrR family transcriptional regulator n=1 Tax=Roseovarius sp. TaxID=1486281 RepID=UPI0025EC9AF3|nr:TetR/AcrR family transcriptional regulator [uncultured Roseovarius sp.]
MPWEKTYQDFDVLDAAMRAFWEHGYQGTSIADLVEATGLNRGSLYAGFKDKRSLYIDTLEHYDRIYRVAFLNQLRQLNDPKAAIMAAFTSVEVGNEDLPGGCLMVNSTLEVAPHDPEIAALVEASMGQVEGFFLECLHRADQQGTLALGLRPGDTAKVLMGMMVGLLVITRASPQSPAVAPILQQVREILA